MAQRDHKQEEPTELRAPEITLCANSCGFPGNPATHNLCQNCFLAGPASASPSPASAPSSSASSSSSSSLPGASAVLDRPWPAPVEAEAEAEPGLSAVDLAPAATVEAKPARASVNRCSSCRKKVGLTGFRCRCGDMFCGEHRYSDRHGCNYDYKAAARDAIARDNPIVRAAKIVRF